MDDELTFEGELYKRAVEASPIGRPDREMLPGGFERAGCTGEFYESVEAYDPVLRAHCRLGR